MPVSHVFAVEECYRLIPCGLFIALQRWLPLPGETIALSIGVYHGTFNAIAFECSFEVHVPVARFKLRGNGEGELAFFEFYFGYRAGAAECIYETSDQRTIA